MILPSKHPLIHAKLTRLRKEQAIELPKEQRLSCGDYGRLVREISVFLAYEVTADFKIHSVEVTTDYGPASGFVADKKPVIVPILRSGLIMAQGFQEVLPDSDTGHIGIHRGNKDDTDRHPVVYLESLPHTGPPDRPFILLDPVVIEGETACRAIDILRNRGVNDIRFVSLVVSTKGVERLSVREYADVNVYCAAVGDRVEKGRLVPGLGSMSERQFGFRAEAKI